MSLPRRTFTSPISRYFTDDYVEAPADPVLAYQPVLIALKPAAGINNGAPWLHAKWLHAARVRPGERVVHIGAGTGYYTAILSRLVGARGRVTAVEFDPELATAARAHLAPLRNVAVETGDGGTFPREDCDVVYVNFAVDRPAAPWLERLRPGGRLLFPLGTISRAPGGPLYGVGLMATRRHDGAVFAVEPLGSAWFIRASGGGGLLAEAAEREALIAAFEKARRPASLHWRVPPPPDPLYVGDGWSLGTEPP